MADCKHDWIGTEQGLICNQCGKQMTAAEYGGNPPKQPKQKKSKPEQ